MIRIEQLDLAFFGHFTNKQFNFGKRTTATPDFHIVYGANEAGKTTFMESYLRLLYGFEARNEPYAFRHGRANLHVSGILQLDDEVREFHRKSTNKNTLVDELGNVLPEASLQAHLGGLAVSDYRKLLCIDDESIEKGGEEIVNSRGDIGTLLFSAAAGISDLWQVLESIRNEAEAIHKSRATKTRLAVLRKEYKEVVKNITEMDIPAGKLGQLTKALKKAESVEAKALNEQHVLMNEARQLERILNALPMLERLDISERAVASLAHYPEHLDITSQQIIELQKNQHQAKTELQRLQTRQLTLTEALEQLPPEPAHAGLQVVIDGLGELHSRYQLAELELDSKAEKLAAITDKMTLLVRERLHHESKVEALIVDAAVIKSLNDSLLERNATSKRVTVEEQGIVQLEARIKTEQKALDELKKTLPEGEGLNEILVQYNAQALSAEYKAVTQALREADTKVEDALDELSIKGQRFSHLPECSLMVEEAEAQLERWQSLGTALNSDRALQQNERQELNTLSLESQQLESVDGLASDQDTQAIKAAREEAWVLHKAALSLETADTFEPNMYELDKVMDGRLAHASDLARLRDLHRQIPRVQEKYNSLTESIRLAEEDQKRIEDSLASVMRQAGIDATVPPKAVVNWVRSYHDAQSCVRSAERLLNTNQAVLDKAQKLKDALSVYVRREQATLEELLAAASTILEVYKAYDKNLQTSQKNVLDLRNQHAKDSIQLEATVAEKVKVEEDWLSLVTSSFPVSLDPEKLAISLDVLNELRELNVEHESLQKQCKQMQRDKTLFTEKLEQIFIDKQLEKDVNPDRNLNKLRELATHASKQVDEKVQLQSKIDKAFADGVTAEKSLQAVIAESQVFAAMFDASIPTGDLTELYETVQKTQHAQMLRKQYEKDRDTLRQTLGVASEEKARAMLAELDIKSVQEKQIEKESELALVNERSKAATEKRTRAEEKLNALTGDGEVAHLVERRTTLELQMTEASLEYLELTLGHRLAEQAINRYRDKHRSAMMQATESAFAQLTDGKYNTLQTQNNGREETLLALDKDRTPKRADQMSKGTRFQLYLALRAAAYDQLAEQGTCLPFICDDIFETFDEERTRAACRVMERIGERGQAIYLTHHRHVVALAQEVCGERVQIHEL
ncbi:AAA family ATPase [bacterium]|nr:AAA family ATPase [bacterium]